MGYSEAPKLVNVFRQHAEWMRIMDVEDVAALNHALDLGADLFMVKPVEIEDLLDIMQKGKRS